MFQFRWLEMVCRLLYFNLSDSYFEIRRVSFKRDDKQRYLGRASDINNSPFQPSKLKLSGLDFRQWFRNM